MAADEPRVERPHIPDYGVPKSKKGLLPWSWATDRLGAALIYWVASVRPDGRPHAVPTWGAWVDGGFWFEGGLETRRARNIAANPAVVVHLAAGDDVVILEGDAVRAGPLEPDLEARLLDGYGKYKASHGYTADPANWRTSGLWVMRPKVALGWSTFPQDATRWRFG